MHPSSSSNGNGAHAGAGDGGNSGHDFLSLDRLGSLSDPLSLHTKIGIGGGDIEHNDEGELFDLGRVEAAVAPASLFQFENLNLESTRGGLSTGPGAGGKSVDSDDVDDPFAALEAAIEEDKPKYVFIFYFYFFPIAWFFFKFSRLIISLPFLYYRTEPSPEWKRMLDAIQTEEEEQPGAPPMVPDNLPPSSLNTATAAATASMTSPALDEDIDLDAPILLHPTTEGNNNNNDNEERTAMEVETSPSQVVAAAEPQDSATTTEATTTSESGGGAGGLAGMLLD
jgi:hypothetical protein